MTPQTVKWNYNMEITQYSRPGNIIYDALDIYEISVITHKIFYEIF